MIYDPFLRAYILFWLAVIGSVTGSLLDCMASRWMSEKGLPKGRSRCEACGHILGPGDLIPIFSYLFHGGKCRYCKSRIPADCILAELAGAFIFAGMGLRFGWSGELFMWLVLGGGLLFLSLADARWRIIPDEALLVLLLGRLAGLFLLGEPFRETCIRMVLGAGIIPGALLAIVLLMDRMTGRETMGGGDIKLMFVLGLYLDWMQMLLLLLLACALGLAAAALKGRRSRKAGIPFGPFLSAACLLTVWYGEPVLAWYRGFF